MCLERGFTRSFERGGRKWFKVGADGSVGQSLADVAGDAACRLMATLHCPVTGYLHVQEDELAGSGLAGLEVVELDSRFLMGLQDALHGRLVLSRKG